MNTETANCEPCTFKIIEPNIVDIINGVLDHIRDKGVSNVFDLVDGYHFQVATKFLEVADSISGMVGFDGGKNGQ